ncbi:MAG: MBL fold metallo-hydrolase [Janthinobacterium lividum]
MKTRQALMVASALAACLWSGVTGAQARGTEYQNTIAARSKFFGAENVDQRTGMVRRDRVIISWVTNASLAASIEGRVVLLDTYINRLEVPPAVGQPDLRRTPIDVSDLVDLHPEAIFLGHGHGDHADNAAYVAKLDHIPIYATPETCTVMQADVQRLASDPNTANGGVKIIPDARPVQCIPLVSAGSVPGAEVARIKALWPVAGVIAFKHIHSGAVPTDTTFNAVPVNNTGDPREPDLYPPGLCVAPFAPNGLQGCLGVGTELTPQPGQVNLTTSGFGSLPGAPGGPISLFYQFVLCNGTHFTFVWHNTTGPLLEGAGSDPGLPSPAIGAHLFQIMDALPETDVEFGSIVSLGYATNGVRDAVLYQQHIRPQIYVPIHMTDVAAISSSLEFKKAYIETLANSLKTQVEGVNYAPEARWIVDPNDYLRPMVFDPDDARWRNADKNRRISHDNACGF